MSIDGIFHKIYGSLCMYYKDIVVNTLGQCVNIITITVFSFTSDNVSPKNK